MFVIFRSFVSFLGGCLILPDILRIRKIFQINLTSHVIGGYPHSTTLGKSQKSAMRQEGKIGKDQFKSNSEANIDAKRSTHNAQ